MESQQQKSRRVFFDGMCGGEKCDVRKYFR